MGFGASGVWFYEGRFCARGLMVWDFIMKCLIEISTAPILSCGFAGSDVDNLGGGFQDFGVQQGVTVDGLRVWCLFHEDELQSLEINLGRPNVTDRHTHTLTHRDRERRLRLCDMGNLQHGTAKLNNECSFASRRCAPCSRWRLS